MADTKISALAEAATLDGTEDMVVVQVSTKRVGVDTLFSTANALWSGWVFPIDAAWVGAAGAPLTSTDFDGDAFSTAAKTTIDLSIVYGVPAGIRAILAKIVIRDSGSAASSAPYFGISPNTTAGSIAVTARAGGMPNDYYTESDGVCPLNANGDCYYQCEATGAGTLDVIFQIWGYLL